MERKVGEIFQYNDEDNIVTLQVIEGISCKECFFNKHCTGDIAHIRPIMGHCTGILRTDKTGIVFKKINNINNMNDKRYILISLEEAREWYNSADPFKRDLALRTYSEEELKESYSNVISNLSNDTLKKNRVKHTIYEKLLNTATYVNSIYPKKYIDTGKGDKKVAYYFLSTKDFFKECPTTGYHKGFYINKTSYMPEAYLVVFNSEEATKKAIDILGDELKILFE